MRARKGLSLTVRGSFALLPCGTRPLDKNVNSSVKDKWNVGKNYRLSMDKRAFPRLHNYFLR